MLLRGGRLLVAKEKRPRALVEFGPSGSTARGLSKDDFLAPDEAWEAPAGDVDYVATAMWRLRGAAKRSLADISGIAVGRDCNLWLLSDKSCCVGRLSLDTPLRPSSATRDRFGGKSGCTNGKRSRFGRVMRQGCHRAWQLDETSCLRIM